MGDSLCSQRSGAESALPTNHGVTGENDAPLLGALLAAVATALPSKTTSVARANESQAQTAIPTGTFYGEQNNIVMWACNATLALRLVGDGPVFKKKPVFDLSFGPIRQGDLRCDPTALQEREFHLWQRDHSRTHNR